MDMQVPDLNVVAMLAWSEVMRPVLWTWWWGSGGRGIRRLEGYIA